MLSLLNNYIEVKNNSYNNYSFMLIVDVYIFIQNYLCKLVDCLFIPKIIYLLVDFLFISNKK